MFMLVNYQFCVTFVKYAEGISLVKLREGFWMCEASPKKIGGNDDNNQPLSTDVSKGV